MQELSPFFRKEWFSGHSNDQLWITGYRSIGIAKEALNPPRVIDIGEVRAILIWGKLKHLKTQLEWCFDDPYQPVASHSFMEVAVPEGPFTIFVTPYASQIVAPNERLVREHIKAAVGFVSAFLAKGLVFHHLFDHIFSLAAQTSTSFGPVIENPAALVWPFDQQVLLDVTNTASIISQCPNGDRNRLLLALQWHEMAIHDYGPNGFVKHWIALETIGMPDTSDIRPLNQCLADAYGLSLKAAQDEFYIGRLFSLRCRIIHDGGIVPIRGELSTYLIGLFVDVIDRKLGQRCRHIARSVLSSSAFDLRDYLSNLHQVA